VWSLLWLVAMACASSLMGCGWGCARLAEQGAEAPPSAQHVAAEGVERPLLGGMSAQEWERRPVLASGYGFGAEGGQAVGMEGGAKAQAVEVTHRAMTPPSAPPPPRPAGREVVRVAVLSDMNGRYGSTDYGGAVHDAVRRLVTLHPDLVLSAGDMVAGQRKGLRYQAMWRAFHQAVTKPLAKAQIPFAVAPGNHDASRYPQFAVERRTYVQTWRQHRPKGLSVLEGGNYPLNYAFKVQHALFIALDATINGPLDRAQRDWLARVLDEHAAKASAVVVFGHVPLYPFAQGHAENEYLKDPALEALLIKHGVDLVVSGHHHAYFPGRRGPLRLASVSCLGAGPRALLSADAEAVAERSFLWIELDEHGLISVDALAAPDYTLPIDRRTLPEVVGLPHLWITRDDLTHDQALAAIDQAELRRASASMLPPPITTAEAAPAAAPRPAIHMTVEP
jgi:predicted phosphodiesterase